MRKMNDDRLAELKTELQTLSLELMYVGRLVEAATREVKRLIEKQEDYERVVNCNY